MEGSSQKRLLMALVLCGVVTVMWQFMFPPPRPVPTEGSGAAAASESGQAAPEDPSAADSAQPVVSSGSGVAVDSGDQPGPGPSATIPEADVLPPQHMSGHSFSLSFSNVGGSLNHVTIEEPEQYIPRDEFGGVFPAGSEVLRPLAVTISGLPALREDSVYTLVSPGEAENEGRPASAYDAASLTPPPDADEAWQPNYQRVVYRWSDGHVELDKIFTVNPDLAYVTDLELVVRDLSGRGQSFENLEMHLWADDHNRESGGVFNPIANTVEAACFVAEETEDEERGDIPPDVGLAFPGRTVWVGVEDRYFLTAVAVPDDGTAGSGCRMRATADDSYLASVLQFGQVTVEPNGEARFALKLYTGPKDQETLAAAGSFLTRSVDYGLLAFLARPLKWLLRTFHNFIPNWGFAIILLTVFIKLLMFPLTQKAYKSMERMREIQPKMVELREKYKSDRTKLTEETMKLYREHNVSPFGCLPMLLQMPIYIALYRTIYSSVELYKAPFALWVTDLSQSDPYYILPVLMSATMVVQQFLMPSQVDNPQMKWMMRLMPVMFGFFMLVLPSGLVLYIFASTLLGVGQQWWIRRGRAKSREDDAVPESNSLTRQQRRRQAREQRSS